MTPADYDQHLLDMARTATEARTVQDRRAWLAERGDWNAEGPDVVVDAAFMGRAMAVMAELVRWIDRIPEAHRG
jgi:hypothetical protein